MATVKLCPMTTAFLECALWAGQDLREDGTSHPLDADFGIDDISEEAVAEAVEACDAFYNDHADELRACGARLEQIGHDFFLTRNRHGAGFWARGDDVYPAPLRDALTADAHVWGTWELYVGDDGKLHAGG